MRDNFSKEVGICNKTKYTDIDLAQYVLSACANVLRVTGVNVARRVAKVDAFFSSRLNPIGYSKGYVWH